MNGEESTNDISRGVEVIRQVNARHVTVVRFWNENIGGKSDELV